MCWQPVTLDCNGATETMGTYRHEIAYVDTSGQVPTFSHILTSEDPCVAEPREPAEGEMLLLRTTAIDSAGNEDCG